MHFFPHAADQHFRALFVGLLDDDKKFIASGAEYMVAVGKFSEQTHDGLNQFIAGLVAEGVIGRLQAVDVTRNQGKCAFSIPAVQELIQASPVQRIGQRIAAALLVQSEEYSFPDCYASAVPRKQSSDSFHLPV